MNALSASLLLVLIVIASSLSLPSPKKKMLGEMGDLGEEPEKGGEKDPIKPSILSEKFEKVEERKEEKKASAAMNEKFQEMSEKTNEMAKEQTDEVWRQKVAKSKKVQQEGERVESEGKGNGPVIEKSNRRAVLQALSDFQRMLGETKESMKEANEGYNNRDKKDKKKKKEKKEEDAKDDLPLLK